MGCDIHVYCERQGANGRWVSVDSWREIEDGELEGEAVYQQRDYDLFGALAGVRLREGDRMVWSPRGMPVVSTPVMHAFLRWGTDGYNHSWLTLEELLTAQRDLPPRNNRGYISPDAMSEETVLCELIRAVTKKFDDEVEIMSLDGRDTNKFRIVFWFDN